MYIEAFTIHDDHHISIHRQVRPSIGSIPSPPAALAATQRIRPTTTAIVVAAAKHPRIIICPFLIITTAPFALNLRQDHSALNLTTALYNTDLFRRLVAHRYDGISIYDTTITNIAIMM